MGLFDNGGNDTKKIAEKVIPEPKGMNPLVRKALDQQIKQLKELQGLMGAATIKKQIDAAPLNQEQRDYIYARMGWL